MKQVYLSILIAFVLVSCTNSKKQSTTHTTERITKIKCEIEAKKSAEIEQFLFSDPNSDFSFMMYFFTSSGKLVIGNTNGDFRSTEMDIGLNGVDLDLENISFFKRAKTHWIMFPIYSEEFPTFQLLEVDGNGKFTDLGGHTYSTDDFKELNLEFPEVTYELRYLNDEPRIYAIAKKDILLSERFEVDLPSYTFTNEEKSLINALTKENTRKVSGTNESWVGNFEMEELFITREEEHSYKLTISIDDNFNASLYEWVDGESMPEEKLEIISSSEDEIILSKLSDTTVTYTLSKKQGKLLISGEQIYLLNPPNKSYPIVKVN